jgi:RNA polymerase sigma-70 factor (ECF subfamily)
VSPSDAHLIALARTARESALAGLYEAYRGKIYTFLLRMTGDVDVADDLTQDTFIKAFRSLANLGDDHRLLPWLYRIATNAAIDAIRRRKRLVWIPILSLTDHREEPHAVDEHIAVSERDHIARTLRAMPVENVAALLLHALEGFSYKEIAEIQGVSLTAVRSRIARARIAFREAYATIPAARSSSE